MRARAGAGLALAAAIALPILAPGREAVRTVTLRDATSTRDPADLLAYDEGAMTTLAVVRDNLSYRDPEAKRLLTDGMNMSGTNWNAKRYMRFLAHLPILLHPTPRSVLVISVDTVFFQCSRAIFRSKLWDPAQHVARSSMPSLGRMVADISRSGFDAENYDKGLYERLKGSLY